jgi:hypothetical protein
VDSDPAHYTWWLDVETVNTWQSGSSAARTRNRASLEGMTAYLLSRGAVVGFYSTAREWDAIVGDVPTTSNLAARASWLAGASKQAAARANCEDDPLTPHGWVALTQYVQNGFDRNVSC